MNIAEISSLNELALPGPDVENARNFRRFQQPAHHRDRIVDIEKIAPLVAVRDSWAVRLEQPHRLAGLGLVEALGDEAHHLALVVLVRPENIEELQPRPLRRQLLALAGAIDHRKVEQVLAPAVEVYRPQLAQRRQRPVVGEALRRRRRKWLR